MLNMAEREKLTRQQLADRREAFVNAYIGPARFNGTRAAKMAGYSETSARQAATELLSFPSIRARINAALEADALSAQAVLRELTDIAAAEWRDFTETRTSMSGESYQVMDLAAKVKSLELLGKAHKLFTDKTELSGGMQVVVRDYVDEGPRD